jgi:hypothetical protein
MQVSNLFKPFFFFLIITSVASCRLSDQAEREVGPDAVKSPVTASKKPAVKKEDMAKFEWEFAKYDFGKMVQGEKKSTTFYFKNAGKSDLIISSVDASCGCTVSKDWPKRPIKPGEKSQIEVEFDSEGLRGMQFKNVTILANTYPATNVINITAEVVTPDIF